MAGDWRLAELKMIVAWVGPETKRVSTEERKRRDEVRRGEARERGKVGDCM